MDKRIGSLIFIFIVHSIISCVNNVTEKQEYICDPQGFIIGDSLFRYNCISCHKSRFDLNEKIKNDSSFIKGLQTGFNKEHIIFNELKNEDILYIKCYIVNSRVQP